MIIYPKDYVVFDFETTGLDPQDSEILEIAAIEVCDGQILTQFNKILKRQVPEKITEITGITQEMSDQGEDPNIAIQQFIEFLPNEMPLIGHNIIRFDIEFLIAAAGKHTGLTPEIFRKKVQLKCVDTAALYKGKIMGLEQLWYENHFMYGRRVMELRAPGVKYNLGLCCDEMGIPRNEQHRAMADVNLTNQLYRKLCLETEAVAA